MDEEKNLDRIEEQDDIEAQLAALGLFDNDDDDDTTFSDLDGQDPFAALNMLDSDDETSGNIPADGEEMDLDKQLEMLLMADKSATEEFELIDLTVQGPVQSVYDPEAEGMSVLTYVKGAANFEEKKSTKLFENVTWFKIIATTIIGLVIIATGAVTTIMATQAIRDHQVQVEAVSHFLPITIPTGGANNGGAIFLGHSLYLNSSRFTISRIVPGFTGTVLYFEENFDPDNYTILLYNQARNLIAQSAFSSNRNPSGGTVLVFDSIPHNTLFLTLFIKCNSTNNYISFNYRFTAPPAFSRPVYLKRPIAVTAGDDEITGFIIQHASFDSSGSRINFTASHSDMSGLNLAPDINVPFLSMNDIFTNLRQITPPSNYVTFEEFGINLGTAFFSPIFNLDGRVDLNVKGMRYIHANPIVDITPSDLFDRDQRFPHAISAGPYTINLEAMAQQRNYVILVFHALDGNNQRVPTLLESSLVVEVPGGIISIPGVSFVSPVGTDVIFDLTPYLNHLRYVPLSRYSLVIQNAQFDTDIVEVPIQLNISDNMANMIYTSAEIAILEALNGLMFYKSNLLSREGLMGLSTDILLNQPSIMDVFEPRPDLTEIPKQAAIISAGSLISNYDFLAVAEIEWVNGSGSNIEIFRRIIKISARSTDGIWEIRNMEFI